MPPTDGCRRASPPSLLVNWRGRGRGALSAALERERSGYLRVRFVVSRRAGPWSPRPRGLPACPLSASPRDFRTLPSGLCPDSASCAAGPGWTRAAGRGAHALLGDAMREGGRVVQRGRCSAECSPWAWVPTAMFASACSSLSVSSSSPMFGPAGCSLTRGSLRTAPARGCGRWPC